MSGDELDSKPQTDTGSGVTQFNVEAISMWTSGNAPHAKAPYQTTRRSQGTFLLSLFADWLLVVGSSFAVLV